MTETAHEISPQIISVLFEKGTGIISRESVITQGTSMTDNRSMLSIKVEKITAADANIIMATKETTRINRFLLDVL